MYPDTVEIDGEIYKINTDYKVALACFRAINDDELSDVSRAYAVITILFGHENPQTGEIDGVPDNANEALKMADKYLRCGNTKTSVGSQKADMDFEYDMPYIMASFMSDYGIDLEHAEMHWWKFCELISGLTEQSILSKIRDLRNTDLNEYKDPKIRAKLQKAMKNVELPQKKYKATDEDISFLKNLGIDIEQLERRGNNG